RLRGLLRIGNHRWQDEPHEGYPVDRVKSFVGHFVTSYGSTPGDRRPSRVELWQKQGRFTQAILYPQTDGRDTYFVATSAAAAEALTKDIDEFLAGVANRADVNADGFQKLVRSGPEVLLAVDKGRPGDQQISPIEYGIGFRLRLPYRNPTIDAVKLNGNTLNQSATNGWQSWFANGYMQVQVNLPPELAAKRDLFMISCEYTPDVVRRIGWTPPQPVLDQLKR
ncbi:MAG: hypothetical protein GY826_10040, partial [Fuerstiella sp.]|nr:hypothetical protein [Fuerstiella sp.]